MDRQLLKALSDLSSDPAELVCERQEAQARHEADQRNWTLLAELIPKLPELEQQVLFMRHPDGGDRGATDVARELGISRNAVNKAYDAAVSVLRDLARCNLTDGLDPAEAAAVIDYASATGEYAKTPGCWRAAAA